MRITVEFESPCAESGPVAVAFPSVDGGWCGHFLDLPGFTAEEDTASRVIDSLWTARRALERRDRTEDGDAD